MSARATREAGIWVDQSAQASAAVRDRATAAARDAWTQFDSWYDVAAVAAYAREMAGLSKVGQETVTDLFAEYLAHVTAAIRDEPRIQVPKVTAKPVRNGVDPVTVHSRPAYTFKETFALTGNDELALQRAVERGIRTLEDDLMLAARQAQQDAMDALKVAQYRRVLRPELSEDGPCGLCVVASGRIYHRKDLLPMHGRCKCETLPIDGDEDPGRDINKGDLDRIYAAAGSTSAADLKRTRVQVSEHGELGPVLHVRGQRFTGKDDLGAPPDPGLRQRRLDALQGVLAKLEQRDADGENVDAQLGEQHRLIEKTEATPAADGGGAGAEDPPPAPPAPDDSDPFDSTPYPAGDLDSPDYSKLTGDEKAQIAWYASDGHRALNAALRGDEPLTARLAEMRDQIRSGLRKYPLPRDYRLSRSSSLDELGLTDYDQLEEVLGELFEQPGFMSTSVMQNPPVVSARSKPFYFDLIVPAGTPALRITGELVDQDNESEREVLVIDARRFVVVGVSFDATRRRYRVRAIVLTDEENR